MKIVINAKFGGFNLSSKALKMLGLEAYDYSLGETERDPKKLAAFEKAYDKIKSKKFRANKKLVKAVETLGTEANTPLSHLQIVEIPDDVDWVIEEYDGLEHVAEKHRTWR